MAEVKRVSQVIEKKVLNTLEMKKSLAVLSKANNKIKDKFEELQETETSSYYKNISNEHKREIDLKEVQNDLRDLILVKVGMLDSLIIQIGLVKADLYNCEKQLIPEVKK